MKLTSVKCPNCNNPLKVEEGQKSVICEYCRQQVFVEEDGINVKLSLDDNLKDVSKEGIKVAKTIGILSIIPFIIGIIVFIVIAVIIFFSVRSDLKNKNNVNNNSNKIEEQIENGKNKLEEQINEEQNNVKKQFDQFEIDRFNSGYEMYAGEKYGSQIKHLLETVITNNKKNKEHVITVKYNGSETTDPNEITTIKQGFDNFTKYESSLDYNEDGFVYIVNISNIN